MFIHILEFCLGMKLNYLKTCKFDPFGSSSEDLLVWPRAMLNLGFIGGARFFRVLYLMSCES